MKIKKEVKIELVTDEVGKLLKDLPKIDDETMRKMVLLEEDIFEDRVHSEEDIVNILVEKLKENDPTLKGLRLKRYNVFEKEAHVSYGTEFPYVYNVTLYLESNVENPID